MVLEDVVLKNYLQGAAANKKNDDRIGIIRRGIMSRTKFQIEQEESAETYLNLPISARIAAVDCVELNYLTHCRSQGFISAEDFRLRAGKCPLYGEK